MTRCQWVLLLYAFECDIARRHSEIIQTTVITRANGVKIVSRSQKENSFAPTFSEKIHWPR